MSTRDFALRATVFAAITIAFYFTVGFHSPVQIFAIAVAGSLGSHAVLLAIKRLAGDSTVSYAVLAGCAVVAAGASVFVIVDSRGPISYVRYRRVDELMTFPGGNVGPFFKVHGYIEPGSIAYRDGTHTFVMHENGARLAVEIRGPVPDTFQDRAEVVVTGHLRRAGGLSSDFVFVADELMAKCPSTYNTKDGPKPAAQFR